MATYQWKCIKCGEPMLLGKKGDVCGECYFKNGEPLNREEDINKKECCEKCFAFSNSIFGRGCYNSNCPCHSPKDIIPEIWEQYVIQKGKFKYIREDIYLQKIEEVREEVKEKLKNIKFREKGQTEDVIDYMNRKIGFDKTIKKYTKTN